MKIIGLAIALVAINLIAMENPKKEPTRGSKLRVSGPICNNCRFKLASSNIEPRCSRCVKRNFGSTFKIYAGDVFISHGQEPTTKKRLLPSVKRACTNCVAKKTRCDNNRPCGRCAKRNLVCEFRNKSEKQINNRQTVPEIAITGEKLAPVSSKRTRSKSTDRINAAFQRQNKIIFIQENGQGYATAPRLAPYTKGACNNCAVSKKKCDENMPCSRCANNNLDCRRGKKNPSLPDSRNSPDVEIIGEKPPNRFSAILANNKSIFLNNNSGANKNNEPQLPTFTSLPAAIKNNGVASPNYPHPFLMNIFSQYCDKRQSFYGACSYNVIANCGLNEKTELPNNNEDNEDYDSDTEDSDSDNDEIYENLTFMDDHEGLNDNAGETTDFCNRFYNMENPSLPSRSLGNKL